MKYFLSVATLLTVCSLGAHALSEPAALYKQSNWDFPCARVWTSVAPGMDDVTVVYSNCKKFYLFQTSTGKLLNVSTVGDNWRELKGWNDQTQYGSQSMWVYQLGKNAASTQSVVTVMKLSGSSSSPYWTTWKTFSGDSTFGLGTNEFLTDCEISAGGIAFFSRGSQTWGLSPWGSINNLRMNNVTVPHSISYYQQAKAYPDGQIFIWYVPRHIAKMYVIDLAGNVLTDCSPSFSGINYSPITLPVFTPKYTLANGSSVYPILMAKNGVMSTFNASASYCTPLWVNKTSSDNYYRDFETMSIGGSYTQLKTTEELITFLPDGTTLFPNHGVFAEKWTATVIHLKWLDYKTGMISQRVALPYLSTTTSGGCNVPYAPSLTTSNTRLLVTVNDKLIEFNLQGAQQWSKSFPDSSMAVTHVTCAYIQVPTNVISKYEYFFPSATGSIQVWSDRNPVDYTPAPSTPSPSSGKSSSYSYYSPYYQVTLTSGNAGSAAKTEIRNTFYTNFGVPSSAISFSSANSDGITTFRLSGTGSDVKAARAALSQAYAGNSTAQNLLGFSTITQTFPDIAAAFGSLFIILIAVGVGLVVLVILIIVCCCCCCAKAAADASAPPQQTVVMAQQPPPMMMQQQQVQYAQPMVEGQVV